jgi:flagellar protein FlaF
MLDAYRRNQLNAESPRAMERRLLAEITSEIVTASEKGLRGPALISALHRNRELWAVLQAACLDDENRLEERTRATIVSLALWVNRFTSQVVAGSEDAEPLIEVNRAMISALG